jgi:hypothetical protein
MLIGGLIIVDPWLRRRYWRPVGRELALSGTTCRRGLLRGGVRGHRRRAAPWSQLS